MTHTPDPRAEGLSINDYCALLPRRRHSHEGRGKILLLPSSGLVVVPFQEHTGGWDVAVVEGHGSYPVGGHHLSVSDAEIETAVEISLGEPVPLHFVNSGAEAEALEDGTYILTRSRGGLSKATVDGETRWVRTIIDKVSLRTDEIADQFPVVVPGSATPPSSGNAGRSPEFVHNREEAQALPDGESILTPGGIVFRKWVGYYRDGETTWCRFMHNPITTNLLSEEMHFPAKVLGTTDAHVPEQKKASNV